MLSRQTNTSMSGMLPNTEKSFAFTLRTSALCHFVERANQVIECISIAQVHGAGYCCAVPFTTSAKGSPSPELSFMAAEKVQCSWSSLETAGVDGAVST